MNALERAMALANTLSAEQKELASNIKTYQAAMQSAEDQHMPYIMEKTHKVIEARDALQQFIEANPGLFVKPKTRTVSNIRFGMKKLPGKMKWKNNDALCASIGKMVKNGEIDATLLPQLIKTTHKPVVAGLEKLDAKLLKRLGVAVGKDTEAPFIKCIDSEIEKAVDALIEQASKDSLDAAEV